MSLGPTRITVGVRVAVRQGPQCDLILFQFFIGPPARRHAAAQRQGLIKAPFVNSSTARDRHRVSCNCVAGAMEGFNAKTFYISIVFMIKVTTLESIQKMVRRQLPCQSNLHQTGVYKMIGKKTPNVTLKTRVRDESVGGDNPYRWEMVDTDDLFKGKRVILFSLPGAFTPTCSTFQLPDF